MVKHLSTELTEHLWVSCFASMWAENLKWIVHSWVITCGVALTNCLLRVAGTKSHGDNVTDISS